jgi:serine/threonine-protein kinase
MAEVFLGKAMGVAGFEKDVAVKSILPAFTSDPQLTAMLIEEARLATYLNHTNVVQVLDLGKMGDRYFIVMEYVDGADLDSVLKNAREKGQELSPALAGRIVRQVLAGLAFVHERQDSSGNSLNLVHRDVSPPNIMLSLAGEVKLTDFGIAKARTSTLVTEAGVIRGKVSYMSPEQAQGGDLDHRGDLFSLGIVLWELLASRRLFAGDDQIQLLQEVREAKIDPPSTVNPKIPAPLDQAVLRALSRSPADRYQTARDFDRALDRALTRSNLRATAADLEAWLKDAIPPGKIEPLPRDGDEIIFESAPPPSGTAVLLVPGSQPAKPHPGPGLKDRSRARSLPPSRFKGSRLLLAILALPIGIAAAVLILWSPWKPASPSRPPAVLPSPVVEEPEDVPERQAPPENVVGVAVDETPPEKIVKKPRGKGTLVLNSEPWARVIVDGRDTGVTTPTVGGIRLPVGRHKITLVNPELEISKTIVLEIKLGETLKRFVDLKKEGVQH